MYMLTATNTTSHYLFTVETGESFADKARNTVGGFDNMLRRIADRLGETRMRTQFDDPTSPETSDMHLVSVPSGVRVDFVQVMKL